MEICLSLLIAALVVGIAVSGLDPIAENGDTAAVIYPGGKNGDGVYQRIINLMPPHEIYVEPFFGSGAIMRLKRPARLNIGMDLDAAAIARFGGEDLQPDHPIASSSDASGCLAPGYALAGFDERRRSAPSVPTMKYSAISAIARSGEPRSTWRFECRDGLEYLSQLASSDTTLQDSTLVYCDPPYLMSTRGGRRLYRHEMPDVHHRRLLRCCRRLKCMVMISGYWSRMYADALAGWSSIQFESMTRGGHTATEWLWFNFPAPVELHDYQYLGDNFRQRERIKRKKRRWTARLERMPALERQALFAAILETSAGKS